MKKKSVFWTWHCGEGKVLNVLQSCYEFEKPIHYSLNTSHVYCGILAPQINAFVNTEYPCTENSVYCNFFLLKRDFFFSVKINITSKCAACW